MLRAVLTLLRVKLWFATVNEYRLWRAKYRLWAYIRTLPPERRKKAAELSAMLKGQTPNSAAAILTRVARASGEESLRLVERVDQVVRDTRRSA